MCTHTLPSLQTATHHAGACEVVSTLMAVMPYDWAKSKGSWHSSPMGGAASSSAASLTATSAAGSPLFAALAWGPPWGMAPVPLTASRRAALALGGILGTVGGGSLVCWSTKGCSCVHMQWQHPTSQITASCAMNSQSVNPTETRVCVSGVSGRKKAQIADLCQSGFCIAQWQTRTC
jgi:hypothetical protein